MISITSRNKRNWSMYRLTLALSLSPLVITGCSKEAEMKQEKTADVQASTQVKKKPNLLYIFPDQLRLYSMGLWQQSGYDKVLRTKGDPVYTPAIDQLAKESVVFTQVVSNHPVCSPHRAMLMSGMWPSQNGVEDLNTKVNRSQGLREDITTFTDVLNEAGYDTAYVGKVHWQRINKVFDKDGNYVGSEQAPGGFVPNPFDNYIPPGIGRRGNEYWFQSIGDVHNDNKTYSSEPELVGGHKDGDFHSPHQFSVDVEADVIVKYLKNENGERDPNKPFSIVWAPNPPHNPYSSIEDTKVSVYEQYYKGLPADELLIRDNVKANKSSSVLPWNGDSRAIANTPQAETAVPIYLSHVTAVDQQVAKVLQALEAAGEAENTIIVYTTDHGEMMGSQSLMAKNYIYEESFRVPFILKAPSIAHRTDDLMLSTVDIMPTLLALMGLADQIPKTVAGTDYSTGVKTGQYNQKPASALYMNMSRKGVRTDRYSYVVIKTGETELYDNIEDPYQLKNLLPNDIPDQDYTFLKEQLGYWLTEAQDGWAEQHKHPQLISYPNS
ncbi:sulfatase [Colwellia sp. MSW7]|uniref:Sulfatase n=1 Tax=Colwellia maritima TaxID=2912588 RepID=A0ABS9X5A5_9GAMM|nr:sulfatase [Colwellia maritima]MCI2285384.1 sulfatase [Colwellia maritima]